MRTLKKANLKNKRVILRCDFNVPLSKRGVILDDYKIKNTIPTIEFLISKGAKVILISHLGRPDGKIVKGLSLKPIQKKLVECLDIPIPIIFDFKDLKQRAKIVKMNPGQVVLIENIQFYPEEKSNNQSFIRSLVSLADIFVMEAFGQAHRNYASITGIAKYLPSYPGFLFEKEIKILKKLTKKCEKPLIVIIGGAKVKSKAKLINKLSEIADFVLVGGLIAREIKEKDIYLNYPRKIIVPIDEINGKDIGDKTISFFKEKILSAKTIFFNGVMGQTENKKYRKGTEEVLKAIIKSSAFSVVGGGETVEFINSLDLTSKFNHLSTGGGAMIAYLAGEKLPGIQALAKWK